MILLTSSSHSLQFKAHVFNTTEFQKFNFFFEKKLKKKVEKISLGGILEFEDRSAHQPEGYAMQLVGATFSNRVHLSGRPGMPLNLAIQNEGWVILEFLSSTTRAPRRLEIDMYVGSDSYFKTLLFDDRSMNKSPQRLLEEVRRYGNNNYASYQKNNRLVNDFKYENSVIPSNNKVYLMLYFEKIKASGATTVRINKITIK